jgi:hypothetical protein
MRINQEHSKKIKEIEEKWRGNHYRKSAEILADYKFLTNTLPAEVCQYLAVKSKAVADILKSVQKYDQFT